MAPPAGPQYSVITDSRDFAEAAGSARFVHSLVSVSSSTPTIISLNHWRHGKHGRTESPRASANAGEEAVALCLHVAAGVRDIDRQIRDIDPSYDDSLSTLLLPYLEPGAHPHSLLTEKGSTEPVRLPSLAEWESRVSFPVGSCLLSSGYRWPFDVHDSEEACDWVSRRVLESSTLKSLPSDSAAARFPDASTPLSVQQQPSHGVFGPFNNVGIVLHLKSCNDLDFDLARLSVARRERWLHYLHRQCGPLPVMRFPIITHVVAMMVDQREFTDEVAMDVYGVFDDCGIDIVVEGGLLPAFDAAPSEECMTAVENGAVSLKALNGATVLFLACLILQAEDSVQKLLDMEITGMVILKDMADHGLGWLMQTRDARAIVHRWIGCTQYHRVAPPPYPRMSLFLEAWVSRPDSAYATSNATPLRLLKDTRVLDPSEDASLPFPDDGTVPQSPGQGDSDNRSNPSQDDTVVSEALTQGVPQTGDIGGRGQQSVRRSHVASGIFQGSAAGTAIAVYLRTAAADELAVAPSADMETKVDRWIHNLLAGAVALEGSKLIDNEALKAVKLYLKQTLRAATASTLKELNSIHSAIRANIDALQSHHMGAFNTQLFLHYFYRAFLVTVARGRIRDDGEGPLTWTSDSLRSEVNRHRRLILGLPSEAPRFPPAPKTRRLKLRAAVIPLAALAWLLGGLLFYTRIYAKPAFPAQHGSRKGMGRVQSSFRASEAMAVAPGDHVYILEASYSDWEVIESLNGGVGPPNRCQS